MFLAGLLTVAQFSFWGNYLPTVYPVHLRGTGESVAHNIGGRMIGTASPRSPASSPACRSCRATTTPSAWRTPPPESGS